jgi:hypothetical protein
MTLAARKGAQIAVRLPPALLTALKERAKAERRTVANVVRLAVEDSLAAATKQDKAAAA